MTIAQIAFTLILVIAAALFARTLTGLLAKGPGFVTSSLISFGIDPINNGYYHRKPTVSFAASMTNFAHRGALRHRPSRGFNY